LRKTKTREEILLLFESINTPLTANKIYSYLKCKNITLSSIYRTLDTFTINNILIKNTDSNGVAIYTLKQEKHSHYLECKNCHTKVELGYCPYHNINDKINDEFNFQVDEHNVVIYGTCKDCSKKNTTQI